MLSIDGAPRYSTKHRLLHDLPTERFAALPEGEKRLLVSSANHEYACDCTQCDYWWAIMAAERATQGYLGSYVNGDDLARGVRNLCWERTVTRQYQYGRMIANGDDVFVYFRRASDPQDETFAYCGRHTWQRSVHKEVYDVSFYHLPADLVYDGAVYPIASGSDMTKRWSVYQGEPDLIITEDHIVADRGFIAEDAEDKETHP